MAFGKEIKRLREEAKISVQRIADIIGVNADRWRKWESKDGTPRIDDITKIEAFFRMNIEELIKQKSIKKFLIVPHENSTVSEPEPPPYGNAREDIMAMDVPDKDKILLLREEIGLLMAQIKMLKTLAQVC